MCSAPTTRKTLPKIKSYVGFSIDMWFSLTGDSKLETLMSIWDLQIKQTKMSLCKYEAVL